MEFLEAAVLNFTVLSGKIFRVKEDKGRRVKKKTNKVSVL
jgi:hypothetical protein